MSRKTSLKKTHPHSSWLLSKVASARPSRSFSSTHHPLSIEHSTTLPAKTRSLPLLSLVYDIVHPKTLNLSISVSATPPSHRARHLHQPPNSARAPLKSRPYKLLSPRCSTNPHYSNMQLQMGSRQTGVVQIPVLDYTRHKLYRSKYVYYGGSLLTEKDE